MGTTGNVHCDKTTKKSPCDGEGTYELVCGCGKVFNRCGAHGWLDGAMRSRRAHWTLSGHDWRTGRFPVEPSSNPGQLPAADRRTR